MTNDVRRKPSLLVAVPEREAPAFFPQATSTTMADLGALRQVLPAELHPSDDFARIMQGVEILVTAWGCPRLDGTRLAQAPDLALVVHAASSVKWLVTDAFWESGIPISQAGAAMGPAVAELSLSLTLSLLRRTHRMDHALRTGIAFDVAADISRAREIRGSRIGVVGASRTGREYIRQCRALGADVSVYDPYLPAGDGLSQVALGLRELVSTCDVVAVHAPATPETTGLIGASEIAAMPDGAALINTARAHIVDQDALYDAVASGRLDAALDVFEREPLPLDDRWRALPNVLLTAHGGGATRESRARAGQIVVDEIRRYLDGEPLQHSVTRDDLHRMG